MLASLTKTNGKIKWVVKYNKVTQSISHVRREWNTIDDTLAYWATRMDIGDF